MNAKFKPNENLWVTIEDNDWVLENSELRKGKYTGENNPFYGRQHSEETIKKLRELNLGENSPNYGKPLKDHLIDNYLVKLSERGLKEIKV